MVYPVKTLIVGIRYYDLLPHAATFNLDIGVLNYDVRHANYFPLALPLALPLILSLGGLHGHRDILLSLGLGGLQGRSEALLHGRGEALLSLSLSLNLNLR